MGTDGRTDSSYTQLVMKIGIDARLYKSGLGIGRYIEQLLYHLERIDSDDEYVIFLRSEMMDQYFPSNPKFKKVRLNIGWYSLAEQLIVPWILATYKIDCMHFPHFNVPIFYPGRFIVTIHDLIMMKHPDSSKSAASTRHRCVHWLKYRCYLAVIRIAVLRADAIIAVSNCVKNDLEKLLAIRANTITVIHEGVHSFEKVPDAVLPPSIQKPYYINVGNAYPHKNIPFLLNVFEELKRRSASCMLVLVGQQDYFRERIIERIRAKNLSDTVIHLGFVSDAQLWALYRHARAALFPSFHEGFGFGPLEAASAGTPLIVSNIPCFHETLGDAALYIDPRDIHAMIASITVLESDSVQRASLIQRGKERASLFSWDRAAKKTPTLYHSFARNAST